MRLITTISFLILNSIVALSQQYEIIHFNKSEYLGRSKFNDFCQDSTLTLYFATNSGLLKYDGDNFKNTIDREGILSEMNITGLLSLAGDIFIASEQGLFKYNLQTNIVETLYQQPVNIVKTINDKVYFSTENGLYQYNESNQKPIIKELFIDATIQIKTWVQYNNQFILGSPMGLVILDKEYKPTKKGSYLNIQEIKRNSDESLLILGSLQKGKWGLFQYSLGDIIKLTDLPNKGYTDIYLSNLANVLISNKNGNLLKYDGLNIQEIDYQEGVLKFPIHQLKEDYEKNLWALGSQGLIYLKVNSPINHLAKAGILDFSTTLNEQIYFTKNSIVLTGIYGEESKILLPTEFTNEEVYPFRIDNNWYFNKDKKLFRINDEKLQEVKLEDKINFVIKAGSTIIGFGDSSTYELDKSFKTLSSITNFKYDDLIKGQNGVLLIKDNKYVQINPDGDATGIKLTKHNLDSHTYLDDNNHAWIFTDTIIYNITNGKSLAIPEKFTDDNFKIFNIFNDNNGNLWLSTNDAILKVKIDELETNYTFTDAVSFDRNDYFLNTYFKKVLSVNNDFFYFIHENGVSTFNRLLDNANLVAPGLKIDKATAYSKDSYNQITDTINLLVEQTNPISIKNRIVISVKPINFNRENKSIIYYRDIETDQEWTKVTNHNDIYLNDLASGMHILEFKSANIDGIESEYELQIPFSVENRYWTQNWFIITVIILVLIIAFIIYKSINNFKDTKTKELHEKLNKELSDLEKRSHLQILKAERLKQLNELITSQKSELEKKNKQIESQKYELSLTNQQIKDQKDLLEETSSKLKASINYAQRIQDALMSTEIEIKEAIDDSFVYFQPRDVVSGDFYWFNNVIDHNGHEIMILSAVDCTGHGVPGAIVSVVGINLLNNITNLKKIYDPGKILYELNKDIIHNLRQSETQVNDGMDMSIVAINTTTNEIKFAGAKNPLIYIENNELIRIRGDKNAIGGQQRGQEREYITHSIPPSNGKKRTYYLFSDGYQDQFGGVKGFKFLTSNFKDLLLSIHDKPVIDQKEILYNTINDWKGDYDQTDDMLVIGFKF